MYLNLFCEMAAALLALGGGGGGGAERAEGERGVCDEIFD